ncbi:MAG: adenylate/guanylate cyclase domain-containing protein [Leptospira sp.]|nr:adenylate/guanylate cyclase domain-containing protein [Leptospira sp.]
MKFKISYLIIALAFPLPFLVSQSRPIQPVLSKEISNLNSIKDNFTWWVTTEPVDIAKESFYFQEEDSPEKIWKPIPVPSDLVHQGFLKDGRTTVWYRKLFRIDREIQNSLSIRLGEMSDRDRVYLNGILIGQSGDWDSERPQAYDKQRIYDIPLKAIRPGAINVVLIEIKGYFHNEMGIYRDRTEIGPTKEIWRLFYLENVYQTLVLMVYAAVGAYFFLFFIRRRHDRENFYFSLFVFSLIGYSVLRTQWKYEFGIDFYQLKRVQYTFLWVMIPAFYYFLRHYFKFEQKPWITWWDRAVLVVTAIVTCSMISIYLIESTLTWDIINNDIIQPLWLIYLVGAIVILAIEIGKGDRDALSMILSLTVLIVCGVLDVLTARAIINLPTTATYGFIVFVLSLALILANRFVRLHTETEKLNLDLTLFNKASARFVPFEFLRLIEKKSILDVNLGDQVAKEMTVLFSDIRSFTTLSESMSPQDNFYFINSYLGRMGPIIRSHKGFIDKYIGDAVMALFPDHVEDALIASIEMQKNIHEHNPARVKRGYPEISIGIGLHIGKLMLGTIGEKERMEGTVISDAVNLASRLEGLTKMYGSSIIMSEQALQHFDATGKYNYRYIDKVKVKGKKEAVKIYEFYDGESEDLILKRNKIKPLFESALFSYYGKKFGDAKTGFQEILKTFDDKTSKIYIERCERHEKNGVTEFWDGTAVLDSK